MFCQGAGAYKRPLHAELQNVRYIRVKILAGWGKSLGEHAIWQNQAYFGEDFYTQLFRREILNQQNQWKNDFNTF